MEDEIIKELRQIKEEIAREYDYDVRKLAAHLDEKAKSDLGAKVSNPLLISTEQREGIRS